LPYDKMRESNLTAKQQKPTIVQLVDNPKRPLIKEYELDQRPTQPTPEPPLESSRLAEQNQKVDKETAPKGDDVRDQTPKPASNRPAQAVAAKNLSKAQKQKQKKTTTRKPTEQTRHPVKKAGKLPAERTPQLPSLEQLTQLSTDTLSRISSKEQAAQQRIKERADIETGDTVWLNLKRGLLISFFRRFRNQIEGVWNYPRVAIENEMQGTLLLKITVDTEGELIDVDLLKSSGHETLDYEAIQAVYRAAPFGPLGKHYPHPELKIMANFRYQLSGKFIYGKRR